jgi:hypothetical protein
VAAERRKPISTRFQRARRALPPAQEEAQRSSHSYSNAKLLLLDNSDEGIGIAAQILCRLAGRCGMLDVVRSTGGADAAAAQRTLRLAAHLRKTPHGAMT